MTEKLDSVHATFRVLKKCTLTTVHKLTPTPLQHSTAAIGTAKTGAVQAEPLWACGQLHGTHCPDAKVLLSSLRTRQANPNIQGRSTDAVLGKTSVSYAASSLYKALKHSSVSGTERLHLMKSNTAP